MGKYDTLYKEISTSNACEMLERIQGELQSIQENAELDFSKAGQYTVGQWMDVWFENCAKIKVRPSSHQTYRGYIDHHIKPHSEASPWASSPPLTSNGSIKSS